MRLRDGLCVAAAVVAILTLASCQARTDIAAGAGGVEPRPEQLLYDAPG